MKAERKLQLLYGFNSKLETRAGSIQLDYSYSLLDFAPVFLFVVWVRACDDCALWGHDSTLQWSGV